MWLGSGLAIWYAQSYGGSEDETVRSPRRLQKHHGETYNKCQWGKDTALFGTVSYVEWCEYIAIVKDTAKHTIVKETDDVNEFWRTAIGFSNALLDELNQRLQWDLWKPYRDPDVVLDTSPEFVWQRRSCWQSLSQHGSHVDSQTKHYGGIRA